MFGVLLTKWTVRLSLACYVAYLAGWLLPWGARWPRKSRAIWTIGCVLFDVHVACAFHFYHRWSHVVAWQHTAEKTKELLGVAVGDGIYFSYLFLVLWFLDVVWLWLSPAKIFQVVNGTSDSRTSLAMVGASPVPLNSLGMLGTPWWRLVVHIFLLFIAVNGAIVFEAGPTRWAGIGAGLVLGCLAVSRGYKCLQLQKTKCPAKAQAACPTEASLRSRT